MTEIIQLVFLGILIGIVIGFFLGVLYTAFLQHRKVHHKRRKRDLYDDLDDFENDQPFALKCTVEAEFEWSEKIQNDGKIDILLEKNAQALLIGYLRPIVANITNVSKFPAYNLPFINLNE